MLRLKLRERQRELELRDGEMARRLGIPRTSYNSIKTARSGDARISLFMARRIVAAFPELAPYALADDEETQVDEQGEP